MKMNCMKGPRCKNTVNIITYMIHDNNDNNNNDDNNNNNNCYYHCRYHQHYYYLVYGRLQRFYGNVLRLPSKGSWEITVAAEEEGVSKYFRICRVILHPSTII